MWCLWKCCGRCWAALLARAQGAYSLHATLHGGDFAPPTSNYLALWLTPASACACRTVRDLSVVEVVPLDALLGALGSDARPVAERLHRLLLPSYFPGPEEGPACVAALLRQQPEVPTCSHMKLLCHEACILPKLPLLQRGHCFFPASYVRWATAEVSSVSVSW